MLWKRCLLVIIAVIILSISMSAAMEVHKVKQNLEIYKVILKHHQKIVLKQLKRKHFSSIPNNIYVHIEENYFLGLMSRIQERMPVLWIYVDKEGANVSNITLKLQIPSNVEISYGGGDIPDSIHVNKAKGLVTITYDTADKEYINILFILNGKISIQNQIVNSPQFVVSPDYCAVGEKKELSVVQTDITLNSTMDMVYTNIYFHCFKNLYVINSTPTPTDCYIYNDSEGYGFAWITYMLNDTNVVPKCSLLVGVERGYLNEGIWCDIYDWLGKFSETNVHLVDVMTEPRVNVTKDAETWICYRDGLTLDPVNYTIPHGFVVVKAVDEYGNPMKGAWVDIWGYNREGIYNESWKTTNETGCCRAMLSPGNYTGVVLYGDGYDGYASDYFDIIVPDNNTTYIDVILKKIPMVYVFIDPIKDNLVNGYVLYDLELYNPRSFAETVHIDGSDLYYSPYYNYEGLNWSFSENDFTLLPGEWKVIKAYAVPTDHLAPYGTYFTWIYVYPSEESRSGFIELTPLLHIKYFESKIYADKDIYYPGDTINLHVKVQSVGGPYFIDAKLYAEFNGYNITLSKIKTIYPKNKPIETTVKIHVPKYIASGYCTFKLIITSSDGKILLGKADDTVIIEGLSWDNGGVVPKFNVSNFSFE